VLPAPETPEQKAARDAWKAQRVPRVPSANPLDPLRPLQGRYPNVVACGTISVHGFSADWTEAITIRAEKDKLGLSTDPRTFDLAGPGDRPSVFVDVYSAPFEQQPFCTDIGEVLPSRETWTARRAVTIQLSPPGILRDHLHLSCHRASRQPRAREPVRRADPPVHARDLYGDRRRFLRLTDPAEAVTRE
jgi:hypothetical protein